MQDLIQEIISTIQEEEAISTCIRIGGLAEGWQQVEVIESIKIEDIELPDDEIMIRKITKALWSYKVKGLHVVLTYHMKINVMQSKPLKGTKIWLADELTPTQLKVRKGELAKIKKTPAETSMNFVKLDPPNSSPLFLTSYPQVL